jgi:leucyl-tRNA synthetase
MSKSRGNVVTPDEVVERYGADILRLYLLFMAPFERDVLWDEEGISGAERFLGRVWRLCQQGWDDVEPGDRQAENALRRATHKAIRRVTEDIDGYKFNTALAALMEFVRALSDRPDSHLTPSHARSPEVIVDLADVYQEATSTLVRLLAPFAPHIAEELWARLDGRFSVHHQPWPVYDAALARDEKITLVVQVNGKVRDRIQVPADISDEQARGKALASARVQAYLEGRDDPRVIIVPGRLVNVVVS